MKDLASYLKVFRVILLLSLSVVVVPSAYAGYEISGTLHPNGTYEFNVGSTGPAYPWNDWHIQGGEKHNSGGAVIGKYDFQWDGSTNGFTATGNMTASATSSSWARYDSVDFTTTQNLAGLYGPIYMFRDNIDHISFWQTYNGIRVGPVYGDPITEIFYQYGSVVPEIPSGLLPVLAGGLVMSLVWFRRRQLKAAMPHPDTRISS